MVTRRRATAPNPNQGTLFDFGDLLAEPEPPPVRAEPRIDPVVHVYCDCGGQPGHHADECAITVHCGRKREEQPRHLRTVQAPAPQVTSPEPAKSSPPPAGLTARVKANIAALTLVRDLAVEDRPATEYEVATLAGWSGWGAVPAVFDDRKPEWQWARDLLASTLDPAEYKAAARSTLNAHYTGPQIVDAMWRAVAELGFTGGRVLEPGCGSGNFIAAAPPGTSVTGIELDPTTAAIARARCPGATVVTGSFADRKLPEGFFDLTIGNVPFGRMALHDPEHNRGKHSIHNHFIVKALHLTRPGGLVAVITSRYTLDAESEAARREIHSLADLAVALRLPSGAHMEVAGTHVVTDLLIFRRREDDRPVTLADWLTTTRTTIDGAETAVNQHFTRHPEWVLGTLTTGRGMFGAGELMVTGAADLARNLPEGLRTAISAALASGLRWTPGVTANAADDTAEDDLQDGHIVFRDGKWQRAENGILTDHVVPRTQVRELAALVSLRDAALAVLREETATDYDTPRLATLRDLLRSRYDAYVDKFGHLNRITERRTGRTDPATGDELMARIRPKMGGFRTDPHAPLVFALEEYDPETCLAAGAPILTRRVIARREPPVTADNPGDALAVCLDTHGKADLAVIAGLLSVTKPKARELLGTLVFDDPATSSLLPAAEYLSGDVRARLRAAETAVLDDGRYEPNVTALRAVIPQDLTPGEIDARMGAPWISADIVRDFLRDILDDNYVKVEHPGGQVWHVSGSRWGVRATTTWGTGRYPAPDLAQTILEQRRVEVRDRTFDGKYIINLEDTAAAAEKAAEMQERFGEWVWEDPERAAVLAKVYNDTFNAIVLRNYDDVNLTLPGLSAALTLYPHQVAAVARIIAEPAVLLAHEVGAGKTAEMITGAMELRRLGLARKPAIVVPGHLLDQFAGEWMRLYPMARILITRKEDLQADKRRRLVARVATGDWDGVIMSQSTFERIPLSPKAMERYLDREIEQFKQWLDTAEAGRSRTVKRLEAAMLRAAERVKAKLDSAKDAGITFEETGIDYLFVDEAHLYKNLRTVSAIADAAIDGSKRATDLDAKLCWLRDRNGDRVVTFATATPVANSITEIHVMQRYLRPDLLADAGVDVFDSWAATFGELVTEVELAPEGGGTFRLNTRFARFRNVPELLRMFHVFADVKLADDLNLDVPQIAVNEEGKRETANVTVAMTDRLRGYVDKLAERADKIRSRMVRPEDDNMLTVTGDGRKAALDLRLVGLPQLEPGKIEAAAREIHARWHANQDRAYPGPGGKLSPVTGCMQFVFIDLGTPRETWNAYSELRDQLAQLGMPRAAVRFIHDAKTDQAKANLFAACRAGNVAVLVGSTQKMGVGTNAQDRALVLHHLDAPWRPADVAQRDGRILRPGNLNDEIEIVRYVTAGSFDGYSWQILARKAAFIGQVMRGRLDVREIEDIGDTALSYAEVKAIATGNPLLMDQAKALAALTKLQRAERAHHRNQVVLKHTIRDATAAAVRVREEHAQAEHAIAIRQATRGDLFRMTVDGIPYAKRADAADAIRAAVEHGLGQWQFGGGQRMKFHLGGIGGFSLHMAVTMPYEQVTILFWLDGIPGPEIALSTREARDGMGVIKRLEYRVGDGLEAYRNRLAAEAIRFDGEARKAAEGLDAPFPRAAELAAAEAESARVKAALDAMAKKDQKKAGEAA